MTKELKASAGREPHPARRLLSIEGFAAAYYDERTQSVRNKLSTDPDSMQETIRIGRRRYVTVEAAEAWLADMIAKSRASAGDA